MQPLSPELGRVYEGLHQGKLLEKKAELASPEEAAKALQEKAVNDFKTFEFAKTAAGLMNGARAFMGTPFGKGLGVAAGAAIPTVAAGNMISNHATEQARNRALETGVGLAGVGATMYGLHRLAQPKQASDEEGQLKNALLKLASVGYLDEMLATATAEATTEEARKLAHEVRCLNREFACQVLRDLVG
jgi:pyruvate/2-oxoglutarate dehydrogenase complex dihydrolipoamide acyltransferase (E2) component